jgi:hypothetical protein
MEENTTVLGTYGDKEPGLAAPAAQDTERTAPGEDRPERSQRTPADGRYAAARRKAEAQRDAAIQRMEMDVAAQQKTLAGEQEKTRQERARLVAEEQVRQIGQLDSEIKSLDDLMAMPEYDSFYALVRKGVNLVDAYKLTQYDKLVKRATDAAARQTMRSLGSRQHLTALAGQPGNGEYVSVPAEIAAEYRLAKPGISDEEIRRKYRKYQKYQRQ